MSNINYYLVANGDRVSITVLKDGKMHVADSDSHANINEIIEAALHGDENIVDLFDVRRGIERRFERLGASGRVTISGDDIYLDGDPAPPAISKAILDHYNAGTDFSALVNFLEKLANNPSASSIEQLYPWLDATGGFTISEDGDLIAYKGVAVRDGSYVSVNQGRAIVNGVEVQGAIPNGIGDTIEMPRSEVMDDSSVGCAQGLHAGTYEYAKGWAQGALLEVLIDPRDVVSVPADCGAQKLRTCRYTVLDIIDAPHTTPLRGFARPEFDPYGWGDDEDVASFDEFYGDEEGLDIGDVVQIIDDWSGQNPDSVGEFGTVIDYEGEDYVVQTDSGRVWVCYDGELEVA